MMPDFSWKRFRAGCRARVTFVARELSTFHRFPLVNSNDVYAIVTGGNIIETKRARDRALWREQNC